MYEYIDNGNLEQWLHGDVGPVSPLTWDIRMKIAIGTAKGYNQQSVLLLALLTGSCSSSLCVIGQSETVYGCSLHRLG